jgi:hypothetical protein
MNKGTFNIQHSTLNTEHLRRIYSVETTDEHGFTRIGAEKSENSGLGRSTPFSDLEFNSELSIFIRVHPCLSVVGFSSTA